jgi:hypothetical protein
MRRDATTKTSGPLACCLPAGANYWCLLLNDLLYFGDPDEWNLGARAPVYEKFKKMLFKSFKKM